MDQTTPNLPVTIPPPSSARVTNCISKCKISTAYTSFFTNGSINNHSTFTVNNTSVIFDYLTLYSAAKDTGSNINTINVNKLSTYYLSEIRVYSPPINTYTDQLKKIDSEIVFIHNLRDAKYINSDAKNDIPKTVVFFLPSNVKVKAPENDKREYPINTLSYTPFTLNINNLIPKRSKFYSYISTIPITTSTSVSRAEFIPCMALIFNITPISVLGINENIITQIKNTINSNSSLMCPSGSLCNVTQISYAPMGLNPNANNYYLSCGDVSPQRNIKPSSSSSLFKKYNINVDTVYKMFSIIVGGFIFIIMLWVVCGIIIGFLQPWFDKP